MRRWPSAVAAVILLGGCSSSPSGTAGASPAAASSPVPSPSAVARQVLRPATALPVVALCSQALTTDPAGNTVPLLCSNGGLNVTAWRFFAPLAPRVLSAGPAASLAKVQAALCRDVNLSHASVLEEASAGDLATAYYGWNFATEPTDILYSMSSCPR